MEHNYQPDSTWIKSDPAAQSIAPELPDRLHSVITSEYSNTRGIVILRNGFIVYEEYFNGWNPNTPIHVASVTKSILSSLVGIALEQGYLKSVEQKILDFFPEYTCSGVNDIRTAATLKDLLTMTLPYTFEDWKEPLDKLCSSPDWARYALDQIDGAGRIGTFQYSTSGAHLLSAVLSRATGRSAREYANEFLFSPTGMCEAPDYPMTGYGYEDLFGKRVRGWVHDPQNITAGGWGLTLTARDMARFGLLYLENGRWGEKQVVPRTWVAQSTKPATHHYGYLWWLYRYKNIPLYAAVGDGGNAVFCIPDLNVVAAVASLFAPSPRDRWLLVKDHILPLIE